MRLSFLEIFVLINELAEIRCYLEFMRIRVRILGLPKLMYGPRALLEILLYNVNNLSSRIV